MASSLTSLLAPSYQATEHSTPPLALGGPHFLCSQEEGALWLCAPSHLGAGLGASHGQSPFTPASQEAALSHSSSASPPVPPGPCHHPLG